MFADFLISDPTRFVDWFAVHNRFHDPVKIIALAQDLLFIPRFDAAGQILFPAVSPGWTLNLEMYFYVLFAVALKLSRSLAPLIVVAALSAVMTLSAIFDKEPYLQFYAHGFVVFFIWGIASYYVWQFLPSILTTKRGAVLLAAAGAGIIAYGASNLASVFRKRFGC
jgi:exopolysaccharide production protein ExoZ